MTGCEIYALIGALFAAGFIYFGFRLGRITTTQADKQFDVGKLPLSEHDPYQEALETPEEVIKDRE
jgi:hypothetical protein